MVPSPLRADGDGASASAGLDCGCDAADDGKAASPPPPRWRRLPPPAARLRVSTARASFSCRRMLPTAAIWSRRRGSCSCIVCTLSVGLTTSRMISRARCLAFGSFNGDRKCVPFHW
ncbi:hypothetical protein DIPPA_01119 [Diplonema papillatum]|nr:hypothetical protein DIPPA_01119 [Diplonema papillatum]